MELWVMKLLPPPLQALTRDATLPICSTKGSKKNVKLGALRDLILRIDTKFVN